MLLGERLSCGAVDAAPSKFDWLRMVAADHDLRGLPTSVAIELAATYFNSRSGKAWPAAQTLADNLGVHKRNVQRALDKLVDAELLGREIGGHGPCHTNRYWMLNDISQEVKQTFKKGRKGVASATQVKREHKERESERVTPSDPSPSFSARRNSKGKTNPAGQTRTGRKTSKLRTGSKVRAGQKPFPETWELGNAELAAANLIISEWDFETVETEFKKFRDWHLDRGSTSANWGAAWKTWCERGRPYLPKYGTSRETGMQSVMAGLEQNLRRNKSRTKH
jgi:hypothetical protein